MLSHFLANKHTQGEGAEPPVAAGFDGLNTNLRTPRLLKANVAVTAECSVALPTMVQETLGVFQYVSTIWLIAPEMVFLIIDSIV